MKSLFMVSSFTISLLLNYQMMIPSSSYIQSQNSLVFLHFQSQNSNTSFSSNPLLITVLTSFVLELHHLNLNCLPFSMEVSQEEVLHHQKSYHLHKPFSTLPLVSFIYFLARNHLKDQLTFYQNSFLFVQISTFEP